MKLFSVVLLILGSFGTVYGQAEAPCSSPEHRQFDFWIGKWNVFNPKGEKVGTSRIELIERDCVILENYAGRSGYTGKSFNIYNASLKKWQQFWVDNQGGVLEFSGHATDKEMRYTATSIGKDGGTILHRMTFFHLGPNTVRQLWEQSTDDGKSWNVVFDGKYVRTE